MKMSEPFQTPPEVENEGQTGRSLADLRFLEGVPVPSVDWAFALVILKLLKTPEGLKVLNDIAKTWINSQADIAIALAQSGAGNIITAWSHSHLVAMMLEHQYMIRKGGARALIQGANWLTGAVAAAEIIGNVAVPATLVFSGKTPMGPTRSLRALLGK